MPARHLGLKLEIIHPEISSVDLTRTQACDLPRPSARAFSQAHDIQLRSIAAALGTDAFFSGGGGDNVFGYLQSVLPVIDRWKRGGGGLLATLGDVAGIAEVSIWAALAASLRRGLRRREARRWMASERFVAPAALERLPFPHGHPWSEAPAAVLPGKRVHGQAMIVIQNHLEGFGRLHDAPIISPLISQPIVETCMAIPTWLWCDGGANRAIARAAFTGRLPPMVIERRTKGAFDAYCARVFHANQGAVREMLLHGTLARQGLIDTDRIERATSAGEVSRPDMLRLLDLVDVEAWIDAWAQRS
jgi:asparagine synthase (glutamine-hydrolysing)